MSLVNNLEIGQKDLNTSLSNVWTEIFQLPKNQKLVNTAFNFYSQRTCL